VSATTTALAPLTRRDKLSLVSEILPLYVRARWQMRGQDVRKMVEHLRGIPAGEPREAFPQARRLGRAVARTLSVLPTDNRCLARSLVLDAMLTRRSLQSVLIVAVRAEPEFAAHAWVEHAGLPLLAPGSSAYQRILEL
jgi:Transglutaminase-like superfamily